MNLSKFFTTIMRNDGSKAVVLTDDRPEWLHEAIRDVHGSDLPNDWIYRECRDACASIDDGALTDDDSVHEYADSAVDVYTRDLYQWSADMCLTDTWANAESEADDLGCGADMTKRISVIQYCAIATIARAMLSACDEHQEGEDES